MKRALDIAGAAGGLVLASPVIALAALVIWAQDGHSPFYFSRRLGKGGRVFRMVKLRSMVPAADRTGVDSTSARDARITPAGRVARSWKIDELPQLWNVLIGEMSLVGPRPQVEREVALYTAEEARLLSVAPGITDFASIVFADLAEVLRDENDADIAYNQLVRPGKSWLGLFYADHRTLWIDLQLIALTVAGLWSRRRALAGVQRILRRHGADPWLVRLAGRQAPLEPMPPPGAREVVTSRRGAAGPANS